MKIYTRGNAAKQWIAEQLSARFRGRPHQILDLGCGSGDLWSAYLASESSAKIIGVDIDRAAIERGRRAYADEARVELRVANAQKPLVEKNVDALVALSAIEHVVDRPAFLRTVWGALVPGGVAYLNYDAGHFRSKNLKERLMVPISQCLAAIGFEGSYMKAVHDATFRSEIEAQGFIVEHFCKHNLYPLKGFMRGAQDEQIHAWYAFEKDMNRLYAPEALDTVMWSSTFVIRKPT